MTEKFWIHNSCRNIKSSPIFDNELRGQIFAYCDTYVKICIGFENIHSSWFSGASCWNNFDGWTDGREKKGTFFGQKSFWFGRIQAGRIFPYFGCIFPYFRTPSGRSSTKKVTFEEKRPLHICVIWVNFSKDKLSPKLSNIPTCPQLSIEDLPSYI